MHYWQQRRLEIIKHIDRGFGTIEVQVAVDGRLAIPMDIHRSVRDFYPTEDEWFNYLTQSGETMLDVYGDARYPLPAEEAHRLSA